VFVCLFVYCCGEDTSHRRFPTPLREVMSSAYYLRTLRHAVNPHDVEQYQNKQFIVYFLCELDFNEAVLPAEHGTRQRSRWQPIRRREEGL